MVLKKLLCLVQIGDNVVAKKILNTIRGRGANTIERAALLTIRQCRQARYDEHCRKLGIHTRKIEEPHDIKRCANRTMLWP